MIRVLIVASGNANYMSPFVLDQVNILKENGIEIECFLIRGKGILGYLKNYKRLVKTIKLFKPNIIHAHYGLSGLLANLQRKVPVITTFHGSDINVFSNRIISNFTDKLNLKSIFISYNLANRLNKKKPIVIPCGVDLDVFYPMNKEDARKELSLSLQGKYVLFSSSFSNSVKNYPLAKASISELADESIELIELKGYTRKEVALLMNAVDVVLLTSLNEGSPQFIKEAMSCNTAIVSVDVGDVKDVISGTDGCYLAKNNPMDISQKLKRAIQFNKKTTGRNDIIHFDNRIIVNKIIKLYHSVINI